MRAALVLAVAATTTVLAAQASERLDDEAIRRIRDEGLNRSQVMDHLWWLTDVYGPRVTGSPQLAQASEWAMKRLAGWGLANVHQERFPFGQGWTVERFSVHLIEPQVQPLIGYPRSWSPSTGGTLAGDVALVTIESDADFEKYRGTLEDKIVLTQPARPVPMLDGRVVLRMNEAEIEEAATVVPPAPRRAPRDTLRSRVNAFLAAEGARAVLDRGSDSVEAAGGSDLSWRTQRTEERSFPAPEGAAARTSRHRSRRRRSRSSTTTGSYACSREGSACASRSTSRHDSIPRPIATASTRSPRSREPIWRTRS
jgi:hypothetical protein